MPPKSPLFVVNINSILCANLMKNESLCQILALYVLKVLLGNYLGLNHKTTPKPHIEWWPFVKILSLNTPCFVLFNFKYQCQIVIRLQILINRFKKIHRPNTTAEIVVPNCIFLCLIGFAED